MFLTRFSLISKTPVGLVLLKETKHSEKQKLDRKKRRSFNRCIAKNSGHRNSSRMWWPERHVRTSISRAQAVTRLEAVLPAEIFDRFYQRAVVYIEHCDSDK
jgi:hypothetical protein